MLPFEGTRASHVKEWTQASNSAKKPASKSTVLFSEDPLRKENLVPSLSTKIKQRLFAKCSFKNANASTAAGVSVQNANASTAAGVSVSKNICFL